jgi:putative transposase
MDMRHVPENRKLPGESFFVTSRLEFPHRLFTDAAAASLVISTLQFYRHRGDIRLYGFVVMPDHVHLLIRLGEQVTLSKFMNGFKSYVGHELHQGPIWQPGLWSEHIAGHEFLKQKLTYIHHNPVRAELVERPEDYPFSSAKEYYLADESDQIDYYW